MRLKYKCKFTIKDHDLKDIPCQRAFYEEYNLICHVLFEHEFLMPICSTGIENKIFKDNMELIKRFRAYKKNLSNYRTELKKRFLKSLYGRRYNMRDVVQDNLFNQNLEKYHKGEFTRLKYVEHGKYDTCFKTTMKLLDEIQTKGLVFG